MVDHETQSRLLAKLVRVLLARDAFATLACLTEALKVECARLRVRWTNDAITDAYRMIDSNTPLPCLGTGRPVSNGRHIAPLADAPPLSREDATAVLTRVYAELARRDRQDAEAS